jgi:hypothetical protein
MAELKDNLGPYILEKALTADRAKKDCFVLDVSRDKNGNVVSSLEHVVEQVDDYLINAYDHSAPVTKLYIVGEWMPSPPKEDDEKNTILGEQKQYDNEVRVTGVGYEKCTLKIFDVIVVMILAELYVIPGSSKNTKLILY